MQLDKRQRLTLEIPIMKKVVKENILKSGVDDSHL